MSEIGMISMTFIIENKIKATFITKKVKKLPFFDRDTLGRVFSR